MTVKASDLMGPRPGEHCILCGAPILVNDSFKGAKGDYAHARCTNERQLLGQVPPRLQEIVYDNDDAERRSAQYDYEYQRGHKAGYDQGFERGYERGDPTQDQHALAQVKAHLDRAGVPAMVGRFYGAGQAGRLAWLLERTGYTIQEIGNPDALTEG